MWGKKRNVSHQSVKIAGGEAKKTNKKGPLAKIEKKLIVII